MFEIITKEQVFKKETPQKPFNKGQKVWYRNQITTIKAIFVSPLKGCAYELQSPSRILPGVLIVSESEIRPYR